MEWICTLCPNALPKCTKGCWPMEDRTSLLLMQAWHQASQQDSLLFFFRFGLDLYSVGRLEGLMASWVQNKSPTDASCCQYSYLFMSMGWNWKRGIKQVNKPLVWFSFGLDVKSVERLKGLMANWVQNKAPTNASCCQYCSYSIVWKLGIKQVNKIICFCFRFGLDLNSAGV